MAGLGFDDRQWTDLKRESRGTKKKPPSTSTKTWDQGTAQQRRDAGITATMRAERKGWMIKALDAIRTMGGQTLVSEDFRDTVVAFAGHPHSPKVWGALTNVAVHLGVLEPTGRMRTPRDPKSHGRKTYEYRVMGMEK